MSERKEDTGKNKACSQDAGLFVFYLPMPETPNFSKGMWVGTGRA